MRSPGSRDRARDGSARDAACHPRGRHRERRSRSARREIRLPVAFSNDRRDRGRGTARAPATAGARATRAACRLDAAPSRPAEVSGSPKYGEPRGRRVVGSQTHLTTQKTRRSIPRTRVASEERLLLFLDERDGRLALASARPRVAGHARESRRAFISNAPRVFSHGVASVRVRRRRRERTRALGLLRHS